MSTNGSGGKRRLENFIQTFVECTSALNVPRIFRQWTAISILAATLEQKVWVNTSGTEPLYPNIYAFLIAHPGVGKSRAINAGRRLYMTIPEAQPAPISLTFASLVDALEAAKRTVIRQPEGEVRYHSIFICADEMGTFIHKYEPDMIDGLSHFYDAANYQQDRRGREHKSRIISGHINILAGSTPQNLMGFMPEKAWGQGFTSRIIMVFSDERRVADIFASTKPADMEALIHDLKLINALQGEFTVAQSYRDAMNQWRQMGEPPVPDHPKLIHYLVRRPIHILRLSMLASISKSSELTLTEVDFLQAIEWLVEAESRMPDIFKSGVTNADSAAMDEIQHFVMVNDLGTGVSELRIVNFARERIPITSILRVIEIMEGTGQIRLHHVDKKSGHRYYSASKGPSVADTKPPLTVVQ